MNKSEIDKRIGELFIQRGQLGSSNPTPQPTPEQPTGDKIPIRILFYGLNHSYKPPIDICINGVWYDFSIAMDRKWGINSAIGTVVEVESPVRSIKLAKKQIYNPNLNNGGFGNCNIKYGAVPYGDSLLEGLHDGFWSRWFDGHGQHTARHGAHGRDFVDENFYIIEDILPSWSKTGKFAIYVSGYGENR